jgi:predicted phosphodiesterase
MDVNKKENESNFDYIIRLVDGKSNGLYDIDYTELFKLGFGVELNPDECRKRYYGLKMILPYLDNEKVKNITEDDILKEYELKKINFEKEKIKFQDQRREYFNLLRESARLDHIKEHIEKVALDVSKQKPLEWEPIYKFGKYKEGILLISDFHFGLEIENFLNTYNKEEFLKRINRLTMKTIEYGKFHGIKTLHVVNLNDLVSGLIHVTVRIANTEDVIEQTQFISEILAEVLCKFANEFEEVNFYSVLDNHSRVTPNKKEAIDNESFARFIPWYLKPRLKDIPNISIIENELDSSIGVIDVCGYTCFAVHGHQDSVKSATSDLAMMVKQFPDYVFLSHYHHSQEDEIHSCEVIVNSSLCGTDEYAKRLRKTSKPAQKFMVFNEEEGRECTYSIRLDR